MSVCDTVSLLGKEIEIQLNDLTIDQKNMINVLINMPQYKNKKRLDLWESDYKKAINDDEENTYNFKIIDMIYEIGAYNLFGAFNINGIYLYYKKTVQLLKKENIIISDNLDISDW